MSHPAESQGLSQQGTPPAPPLKSSAAPTEDAGPLRVCDEDAGVPLGPPGKPGASLSPYPLGNGGYHFSAHQSWRERGGPRAGRRAGRQAGPQAGYKEYYREMLPCLAARENRRAHSREAPGRQDLYLPFT